MSSRIYAPPSNGLHVSIDPCSMNRLTLALCPGRSKARHVPRAPLPDQGVTWIGATLPASRQRALSLLLRSYGLMRRTKSLQLISISLYSWSLQGAASPCWEMVLPDIISAILAWVLGPLPRDASLVPSSVSSQKVPASPQFYEVRHIQIYTAMPLQRCPD
jgi:hypothetical protein